jgi:two-component system alkaline phosphatase synthesis response regulator PhoP
MTKIVIVEDEQAIAEMYRFKLQQAGYEVQCALNGQEGLILAKDFQPNLILLDLMMPKMNGEEMLRKLRATDWGKDIKVIILTNITEDSMTSQLNSLNIERYIVKANYTPSQVAEIIPQVLAQKAA